jgi:CheY-like chemotaxis protein
MTGTTSNASVPEAGTVQPIVILLVEDSPSDVAMTRTALGEGRVANEMYVVGDGEEAMKFLRRDGQYADRPRPDLMILDLNLPRMDEREVLEEIKNDADLRRSRSWCSRRRPQRPTSCVVPAARQRVHHQAGRTHGLPGRRGRHRGLLALNSPLAACAWKMTRGSA